MIKQIRENLSGLPGNLRRVTSGSRFIPEIDGLRFLAIVPVVFQHYSERILNAYPDGEGSFIAKILSHGHIGVYVFFAISGFILALPFGKEKLHLGKPVSLKEYYIRRLTRLEPPYLIAMTLLLLALVVVKHESFGSLLPHFISSCLYIHRLVYGSWSPINPPAWTLEVEVQFYIAAPFLTALYFTIKRPVIRRILLISLIVLKVMVGNTTTLLDGFYLTLPIVVEFFFIGILMADFFLTESKEEHREHWGYDLLTLVSIAVLFSTWTWDKNITWKFVFLASLFATIYGCFHSISVKKFFQLPWITAIGGMCYSIYLLHLGFAEFFVTVLRKISPFESYAMNFATGLLLFLAALFVVSTLFFKLVEQPCMDPHWPRKTMDYLKSKLKVRVE